MQDTTQQTAETPQQIDPEPANIWETVNGMINGFLELLPKLVIGAVVLILFFVIARGVRNLIKRVTSGRQSSNIGMVLGRLAQWTVIFLGILVALAIIAPSVKPADILTLLGVGGVAIGFAFQDILQNFLAGILILLREPFKIGDQIIFNDHEGTVEQIETRATMIKTYDGRRVVIPNGEIYTNAVVVNTAFENRRSQYDVGIGYGDDLREAARVMLEAMKGVEGVLQDPAPDVLTEDLAGSSVNLRARWWTAPERADVVKISHEVISHIKEALDEAGIDMPYPTQVTLFHDQTEETDGDRTRQREGWPAGDDPPRSRTIGGMLSEIGGTATNESDSEQETVESEGRNAPTS